ncbi:hypothetical protein TREVI0001_2614 [Treponema vincentii ATCC 35580]|uniref:Uncharacterized protein n=1 Tax=Treponema vincentii ATCC 35580 TaxID=596324 RepID=C8PNI4_9SPIR|nr:hypothetical protein TREVI0001_2614 [Treponema vincentii ATCC 35580]
MIYLQKMKSFFIVSMNAFLKIDLKLSVILLHDLGQNAW